MYKHGKVIEGATLDGMDKPHDSPNVDKNGIAFQEGDICVWFPRNDGYPIFGAAHFIENQKAMCFVYAVQDNNGTKVLTRRLDTINRRVEILLAERLRKHPENTLPRGIDP